MSNEKTPGYKYYEITREKTLSLPAGYGITKADSSIVGFYADYFDDNGGPAEMHNVEIVDSETGVEIRDLTLIAQHEAILAAKQGSVQPPSHVDS